MKIAYIIPSLANKGPIIVAKDIINTITKSENSNIDFTVFYFDNKIELDFACQTEQIGKDILEKLSLYDIIHSHGFRPDKFLFKNRHSISAKIISTIHCDVFEDLKHSYNSIISIIFGRRWINYLSKMDCVVTLTNAHRSFYAKYMPETKLKVIYNGREKNTGDIIPQDINFFHQLRTDHPGKKIIGSFAGLTSRKGLDIVIRSLPSLQDYIFVILGEGKEKTNLEKLATKLKVEGRCFFLGYRSNADCYYSQLDIYALPSHSEAFPLALIEATLNGISCVCSDIPVLEEVYTQKEVTFFSRGNVNSFCEAIHEANNNRIEKGKNAKQMAETLYSSQVMASEYFKLYKKL